MEKEIETVEGANSLLVRFDGQLAQVVFYMSSHNTFVIRIENEKQRSEKLYVVFNFIETLIAPKIAWDSCKIRIRQEEDNYTLEDLGSGLRVEGNMLYVGQEDLGKINKWYLLSTQSSQAMALVGAIALGVQ